MVVVIIYQLIEQRHNGNKPNIEPTHTSKLAVVFILV